MKRREFLKKLAVSAAVLPSPAWADGSIEGTVTGGGKPLADVVVTDGLICTKTDRGGRFTLPKRPLARFISVTIPSGWRAADRHYRATSEKSFDFQLVPWKPSATQGCTFLQLTDDETDTLTWKNHVFKAADEGDAAFIVHTGDICGRLGMEAHAREFNFDAAKRPVYYCIGNHDLSGEDGSAESIFEGLFGPCWYSFDAGGVHFVVTPMPSGDHRPGYTHEMVADWMRNDLAYVPKNRPVVIFNHMITHPGSPKECGRKIGEGSGCFDFSKACKLAAFVYGHTHVSYFRRRDGIAFVSTSTPNKGGIGHDPSLSRLITVSTDGKVKARSVYYPTSSWRALDAGERWKTSLGAPVMRGEPAVDGGRVFVATMDDDGLGTGAVVALDASSGRELWRVPMANSVKGAVVCFDGKVFAQDVEGHVRAFSAADGHLVWKVDLPEDSWRPVMTGLVIDRSTGLLYAGCDLRICAIEARTGKVRWQSVKRPTGYSEPANTRPAVGEGVIVSPGQWRGIFADSASTGEPLWKANAKEEIFCGAEPLIVGDKVAVLVEKRFNEYDLRTGKLLRSKSIEDKVELPTGIILAGGKYIFGSWKGLVALDEKTLDIAWRISVDNALVVNAAYCWGAGLASSKPVIVDSATGVLATPDGKIRFFRFADGVVTRTLSTGAPYFAAPTVDHGNVYTVDFAGVVCKWGGRICLL